MDIQKTTIQKLLTRCKKQWVQWLIGAAIGALAAAGVITVSGCTASYSKDAAGAVNISGAIVLPVRNEGK